MDFTLVVQGLNVAALSGGTYAVLKIAVPVGLSIRDALKSTALELRQLRREVDDHEDRIRSVEGVPITRRRQSE